MFIQIKENIINLDHVRCVSKGGSYDSNKNIDLYTLVVEYATGEFLRIDYEDKDDREYAYKKILNKVI